MLNAAKLRHLVAVDRSGSFSAAAKVLNLTQSTVTKSVADIEREVGYALFDRQARGVVATELGRDFLNRAARIVTDLNLLTADAHAQRQKTESIIRVGVSPPSIEGLMNLSLRSFVEKNPNVCIHLAATAIPNGKRLLRQGDIDILVTSSFAVETDADFTLEHLGSLNAQLFMRKNHPLATKKSIGKGDITKYSIIIPDPSGIYAEPLRNLYIERGLDPALRLHVVENHQLVAELVLSTNLIAIVSCGFAESKRFRTRFKAIGLNVLEPLEICCAYRARWLPSRAMRAFLSALKSHPPTGVVAG